VNALTPAPAAWLVGLAALVVYANSLGNGFAFDDPWVIEQNPVVTEGRFSDALTRPYWPDAAPGTGNFRPWITSSFALEWHLFDGSPVGFHAVSVVGHAVVSVLVFFLLLCFAGPLASLVGGLVFAVHPVHTEAVANVVGRAEIYAGGAVVAAALLWWHGSAWTGWRRGLRVFGVAALYVFGLGSKEMAVTLPGVLVLLDLARAGHRGTDPFGELRRGGLAYLLLASILISYLLVRMDVLGALTGESAAGGLAGLSTGERLLAALAIWPEYLRLLVLPLDLAMDYQPGVLMPSTDLGLPVVLGAAILVACVALAFELRSRAVAVAFGLAWFLVTILPVSNLVVRADILLAERTLYLPSVGFSLVVAGLVPEVRARLEGRALRWAGALAVGVILFYSGRTVVRNPTWESTATAVNNLALQHPESYRGLVVWARIQESRGDLEAAAGSMEEALNLVPDNYQLTVTAADFFARTGATDRALELYRRATALTGNHYGAYRQWGEHLLRVREPEAARRVALDGWARAGPHRSLFAILSESYVAEGDLEAAVRARRTAALRADATRNDWTRLAELLEALERPEEAAEARRRAPEFRAAPAPEAIP